MDPGFISWKLGILAYRKLHPFAPYAHAQLLNHLSSQKLGAVLDTLHPTLFKLTMVSTVLVSGSRRFPPSQGEQSRHHLHRRNRCYRDETFWRSNRRRSRSSENSSWAAQPDGRLWPDHQRQGISPFCSLIKFCLKCIALWGSEYQNTVWICSQSLDSLS